MTAKIFTSGYERDFAECHRALLFDALFADFARVDLKPSLLPWGEG
ncbi:MAG: hypothetical protein ABIP41_04070 [Croceibacterium sp.]